MKIHSLLTVLLSVGIPGAIAGPAVAVCVDYHDREHFVGSVGVAVSSTTRLDHDGSHVYLVTEDQLTVVSVADPTTPVNLGSITLPEICEDVLVDGGFLYLAGATSLRVYSLADPAVPSALPAVPLSGSPRRLAKYGSTLLVAAEAADLHVLDCAAPEAPTLETTLAVSGNVVDVAFFGSAGYALAVSSFRLAVVEAADPGAAAVVWESGFSVPGRNVVAGSDRAWVGVYRGSTWETDVWDLSNVTAPVLTATLDEYFTAGVIGGSVGFFTNSSSGDSQIRTWDVESLTAPVRLGQIRPWGGTDLDRDGSLLFVSSIGDELLIVDGSDPTTTLATSDAYAPAILRMQEVGGRIHLTSLGGYCPDAKYQILDAADTDTFAPLGALDLSDRGGIFHTDGSIAVVLESGALSVLDVTNEAAPTPIGSPFGGFSSGRDIRLVGAHAYVLRSFISAQLRVIDVSDPSSPVELAPVPLPNTDVDEMSEVPGYLLVTDATDGLLILDLADPAAPVLVPHGLVIGGTHAIEAAGSWAALKNTDTGDVTIVDLADPTSPQIRGVLSTLPGGGAMAIGESVLYVAGGTGATQRFFQVFDVAAALSSGGPAKLLETVSYQGFRYWAVAHARGMLALPDRLLLGRYFSYDEFCGGSPGVAYDGLLSTFPLQCSATGVEPVLAESSEDTRRIFGSPNPFRGSTRLQFSMPEAGPATIVVHDAAGRRVRGLGTAVYPRGTNETVWDGRDDRGRAVSSGVYFLRLETPAGESTRRVVRIR
jgi:hypothetical protein